MVFVRCHTRIGEVKRGYVDIDWSKVDTVGSSWRPVFFVSEVNPLGNGGIPGSSWIFEPAEGGIDLVKVVDCTDASVIAIGVGVYIQIIGWEDLAQRRRCTLRVIFEVNRAGEGKFVVACVVWVTGVESGHTPFVAHTGFKAICQAFAS